MKKITRPYFCTFLISAFFLCACQAPAKNANPPLSQQKITLLPGADTLQTPAEPKRDDSVWDVSKIDVSHIRKERKLIAFTFDDAPGKTLENILAVYAAFNENNPDCKASATLFCNGYFFDSSTKQTLLAAHTLGFELGNHTHTHQDLTTLSKAELRQEIEKTDVLLQSVDQAKAHLFRAPYGRINEQVKAIVQTPILDWSIDTLDWTGVTSEEIYTTVWEQKFSGAIVLLHDGYPQTVDALKRLLPDLKTAGYQVTSVSQMAKAHRCPLRIGNVYIKARQQKP